MALRNGAALLRRIISNSQLPSTVEASLKADGRPVNSLLSSLGIQDQFLSLRCFVHTSQQAFQAGKSKQVISPFSIFLVAPLQYIETEHSCFRWCVAHPQ